MDYKKDFKQLINQVKDKLGVGPRTIVGLDIGLSAVKLAELDTSVTPPKLLKYASVPLPEGAIIEDDIQKEEEIVQAIIEAYEQSGISNKHVCFGFSGPNSVARKLQLAGGTAEEIEDQVLWEAEQYFPFAIDDSKISFQVLGENEGGGVEVIVAAVRADIVLNFQDLIEAAGLRLKIADLGIFALSNILELTLETKDSVEDGSWVIIDLGAQKTEFIIYRDGKVMFSKDMSIGGVMITEEIQRQMGVNYAEAEDLKIIGDANGNLPEEIVVIIDDVVEIFFSEIKKTVDFYVSSTSDESIAGCFITGGACLVPGLIEGLEALIGVSVSFLNPFDIINYNESDFSTEIENEIAHRGAVVLGLAMRQMN